MNLLRGGPWEHPLRAGHQAQRRDVAFIGYWALALLVVLALGWLVDLPDWPWQLAALGTGLQSVGVVVGVLLRDPRPSDYHDHKYLG